MSDKYKVRSFDRASEFYYAAQHEPRTSPHEESHSRSDAQWSGTKDFDAAISLATHGWHEGVQKAEPIARRLSADLVATLARPTVHYEVTGEMFDIGKVIEDEPECWMKWREGEATGEQEESTKAPVTLVLNICVSAGIDTSVIETKGAAVMALAIVLEAAGRPTRIETVAPTIDTGGTVFEVRVVLKDHYDDLQADAVAFGLVHPSFFRRMVFALWEKMGIKSFSYGMPTDTRNAKGDIYIGHSMYGDTRWKSEESAEQWVREQLIAQGVHFTTSDQ